MLAHLNISGDCDLSRVALVLMKGAIAMVAAVEVRNLRRDSGAMGGARAWLAGMEGNPRMSSVSVKLGNGSAALGRCVS